MYETHNDLSESIRTCMMELLNARLADAIDLRLQLKVAHWNVKGPHFIALHKMFDEIMFDEIVEHRQVVVDGGGARPGGRVGAPVGQPGARDRAPAEALTGRKSSITG